MAPAVTGYRVLTDEEVETINKIKSAGQNLNVLINELRADGDDNCQRWVSIGQTHLQQGIMALVRAVAQPESF